MTLAQKQQAAARGYGSIADTFRTILREEGVQGLYKGLLPSLVLVSNPAIQFLAYEQLVRLLSAFYRRRHRALPQVVQEVTTVVANVPMRAPMPPVGVPALTSLDFFVLGAVSKAIATVMTYPYQGEGSHPHTVDCTSAVNFCWLTVCWVRCVVVVVKARLQTEAEKGEGVWEMQSLVRRMVRDEGVQAFFQGMGAKMTQTVLNSAFLFVVYEHMAAAIRTALTGAVEAEKMIAHTVVKK